MKDNYVQTAFNVVCKKARKRPKGWYVVLMCRTTRYGGPEEGGWWRHDETVEAYQKFNFKREALTAKEAVEKLAAEMTAESRRVNGEHCLRETEWCEERGLDADWLREPDGPNEYHVRVQRDLPADYLDNVPWS